MSRLLRDKIRKVVDAQKAKDPSGYQKAEKNNELSHYLKDELTKAGITIADYINSFDNADSRKLNGVLKVVSNGMDTVLYEPFYESNLPSNYLGISDALRNTTSSKEISRELAIIKVLSGFSSAFCFALGIGCAVRGHPVEGSISLLFSADLLRLSYNCYIKKYLSCTLSYMTSSVTKAGSTLFTLLHDTLEGNDSAELVWDILLYDLITVRLFNKARKFIYDK